MCGSTRDVAARAAALAVIQADIGKLADAIVESNKGRDEARSHIGEEGHLDQTGFDIVSRASDASAAYEGFLLDLARVALDPNHGTDVTALVNSFAESVTENEEAHEAMDAYFQQRAEERSAALFASLIGASNPQ